jgi:hypothetical protein
MLFAVGVDGLITDSPDLAVRARDDMAGLTAVPRQGRSAA